jgi:hypothetical protein
MGIRAMFGTKSEPPAPGPKNERLSYLLDVYKLYHGHINTMFNYFLLLAGLIANGYINSLPKNPASTVLPSSIGLFGAAMSFGSFLIHHKSRLLLDIKSTWFDHAIPERRIRR